MLFMPAPLLSSAGPVPTFVAAGTNSTAGTSATMPSGWAIGDLHLIFATVIGAPTPAGHNTPSGWTALNTFTHGNNANGNIAKVSVFYRIAQSGDTTVTLTIAGGTGYNSRMVGFRGVNPTSPFEDLTVLSNQSAASSMPYAQLSLAGANRYGLQFISSWASFSHSASPDTGWTELFEVADFINPALNGQAFTASGTTPAGNMTKTVSTNWGRLSVALKPT